jgi:hypothetical protein
MKKSAYMLSMLDFILIDDVIFKLFTNTGKEMIDGKKK